MLWQADSSNLPERTDCSKEAYLAHFQAHPAGIKLILGVTTTWQNSISEFDPFQPTPFVKFSPINKRRANWKLAGRSYEVDLGDVIPEELNAVGFMLRWAAFIEMSVSPAPTHPDLPFNSCSPAPPTAPPVSSAGFMSPKGLLTSSASKTNTTINHFHPLSASFRAVRSTAHRSTGRWRWS